MLYALCFMDTFVVSLTVINNLLSLVPGIWASAAQNTSVKNDNLIDDVRHFMKKKIKKKKSVSPRRK